MFCCCVVTNFIDYPIFINWPHLFHKCAVMHWGDG